MVAVAALPSTFDLNADEKIFSVVLPAQACNLKCNWCFIGGRQEVNNSLKTLNEFDYLNFMHQLSKQKAISLVAIQGYEALLDETWSYTESLLRASQRSGIPTSLVTNGVELKKYASKLAAYEPAFLAVSLDASTSEEHDKTRGVNGAYERTLEGIKTALQFPALAKSLAVASVLQPGKLQSLLSMPQLLATLGVKQWIVSPLMNVGKRHFGAKVISGDFSNHLAMLHKKAKQYNIELIIDDELGTLNTCYEVPQTIKLRQLTSPNRVIRLSPNGQISVGKTIASQSSDLQWDPLTQNAHSAVQNLLKKPAYTN